MIMLHKRYQFRHFQAVFFVVVGVALAACGEMQSASVSGVRPIPVQIKLCEIAIVTNKATSRRLGWH